MGYYIETGTLKHKADYIVEHYGGKIASHEECLEAILAEDLAVTVAEPLAVIIVVDNGVFEAAAFAYCLEEFEEFTRPDDNRPKTFVLMDLQKAQELTGYSLD